MQKTHEKLRDYSSISPSAKFLLLLKGYTDIPYARKAAELIQKPEKYTPDFSDKDYIFCMRVAHFEARYNSVNSLLSEVKSTNILELSSGYSFRGLEAVKVRGVHYIDTDLPGIIEIKKRMVTELQKREAPKPGKLELIALNAMDEEGLKKTAAHFKKGEIAIVNEGLLPYLNKDELRKLCSSIRNVLLEHGGCWITADIYLKNELWAKSTDDTLQQFFNQFNIEENKFESFGLAEEFFNECGFIVEKELDPDYSKLAVIRQVFSKTTPEQLGRIGASGRMQATWRLKPAH